MASASPITTPCVTCEKKAAGVFKCEGCSQAFCRQHVIEHRDALTEQLDEMMTDHNLLQQTILDETDDTQSPFLTHIDAWEKNSILKIQKIAEEKRDQLRSIHKCRKGTSLSSARAFYTLDHESFSSFVQRVSHTNCNTFENVCKKLVLMINLLKVTFADGRHYLINSNKQWWIVHRPSLSRKIKQRSLSESCLSHKLWPALKKTNDSENIPAVLASQTMDMQSVSVVPREDTHLCVEIVNILQVNTRSDLRSANIKLGGQCSSRSILDHPACLKITRICEMQPTDGTVMTAWSTMESICVLKKVSAIWMEKQGSKWPWCLIAIMEESNIWMREAVNTDRWRWICNDVHILGNCFFSSTTQKSALKLSRHSECWRRIYSTIENKRKKLNDWLIETTSDIEVLLFQERMRSSAFEGCDLKALFHDSVRFSGWKRWMTWLTRIDLISNLSMTFDATLMIDLS